MEERYLNLLIQRYPELAVIRESIENGYHIIRDSYKEGHKLLVSGNGGSAADAEHVVGELMKRFRIPRKIDDALAEKLKVINPERGAVLADQLENFLTAIPLMGCEALTTAYLNDVGNNVFAQQLFGYGKEGDVFLGISTSGNSQNIVDAAIVAKSIGVKVVALTGRGGGRLAEYADELIAVPEEETYMVQELHLPIYHCWCLMLEDYFFGGNK